MLDNVRHACGIDVSKDKLDVHLLPGDRQWQVPNNAPAHEELADHLRCLGDGVRVLLEATGGYERPLVASLAAAGLTVLVVNPRQARRFAEALSANPAKTDKADARSLAQMAATLPLEARPLPDKPRQDLAELVARRRQLVEMIACEKMRLPQACSAQVRQDIKATIDWLTARLGKLDEQLASKLDEIPELKIVSDLLEQEKGVGKTTARILVACLPELGLLDRQAIACLAGVAPIASDSGKSSKARHIRGGRCEVRSALWMAAFNARRSNGKIRPLYERLIAAGKPYKVAMVACMRKLLTILNAMVRRHRQHQSSTFQYPDSTLSELRVE